MKPKRKPLWNWASRSQEAHKSLICKPLLRVFARTLSIISLARAASAGFFGPIPDQQAENWTEDMATLTIMLNQEPAKECCGLCGARTGKAAGPRLFLADSPDAVCRKCGSKHAPSLVALLDLAQVAERVGRIGRHTLVPPLGALLDLARAAEDYTHTGSERRFKAA
jgi:hypothetical protein